jgi:hypothetical protein
MIGCFSSRGLNLAALAALLAHLGLLALSLR